MMYRNWVKIQITRHDIMTLKGIYHFFFRLREIFIDQEFICKLLYSVSPTNDRCTYCIVLYGMVWMYCTRMNIHQTIGINPVPRKTARHVF